MNLFYDYQTKGETYIKDQSRPVYRIKCQQLTKALMTLWMFKNRLK